MPSSCFSDCPKRTMETAERTDRKNADFLIHYNTFVRNCAIL